MATQLHDIQPHEVSLVRRGANRRRFLLAKADTDELDITVADFLAAPAAREHVLLDAVRKSGGDETVEKAAATAARALEALRDAYGDDGMPDELRKAAAQMMDNDEEPEGDEPLDELAKVDADREHEIYKRDFTAEQRRQLAKEGKALKDGSYPIETQADIGPALTLVRSGHGDVAAAKALITRRARELGATDQLPDDWGVKKEDSMSETAQAVPVKKEDGSWDLTAVPEEQRPAFELVLKAHDEEVAQLRKANEAEATKAEEALEIAKAEKESRLTREFIAKSESLEHLAKEDEKFGPVLRDIAKAETDGHLPQGTLETLETVLKAADEQVAKGSLYADIGGRQGDKPASDAEAKVEGIAKALREADPKLTKEAAFAKALELNPDLYTEMQKEKI